MPKKDLISFLKEHKFVVARNDIVAYVDTLKLYNRSINAAIQRGETEEHLKGILVSFLKNTFYPEDIYTINTDGYVDCAISKNGVPQVLIETKKPSNVLEMVTETGLNKKALWELVLYYLEITRQIDVNGKAKRNPDSEIKNLIITDCKKFFVFDSQKFEQIVSGELEKHWEKFKTDQLISRNKAIFYDKAKEFFSISENVSKLTFVCFDIENETPIGIRASYSILSKQILLKDITKKITATPLNAAFYKELLYILGLKEVEENGKTVIKIDFSVENTFATQVYKYLKEDKGIFDEEEVIDKTFSAIIVWTNRLLFIKLFEGQLLAINGNKPEYRILDNEKIQNFDELHQLFFKVLGAKNRENDPVIDRFKEIPYLNSSLFENYEVERDILIKNIRNYEVTVKAHSKTGKSGKLRLVEYAIDFLNSYNFSSVYIEESEVENQKEIIDAAVLGLIFEKINGYKDGSYYTPSSITEYICKETIQNAVVQKVNEAFGYNFQTFDDIKLIASDISKKKQINDIINSLKICDPAVGSGHFLVSALNRIIAIKSELGVLFYNNENRLLNEYDIKVENDVLTITDGYGNPFVYDRGNVASFKVQKTIFCEKRLIIENCLFGVDINDKAVSICQLRLWIELLKNAYYENNVMETLPNIDINIKCGNSLIHKLPVEVGYKLSEKIEKNVRQSIKDYKKIVNDYKRESNKSNKKRIKDSIEWLKKVLHTTYVQTDLFTQDFTEYSGNSLMQNAFEWAIEFPEVLDDDGTFLGFDCVIGNPPYIDSEAMTVHMPDERIWLNQHYALAEGNWDIYIVFFELSLKLIHSRGLMAFITPDKWIAKPFGYALRRYVIEGLMSILKAGRKVFKEAKVDSIITVISKTKVESLKALVVGEQQIEVITNNYNKKELNDKLQLDVAFSKSQSILKRIEANSMPLLGYGAICEGACITSDFYKLSSIMENNSDLAGDDLYYKIVNTGTIEKYGMLWGQKPMTYDGKKLMFPIVNKKAFDSLLPRPYVHRAASKKLIIKGMTLLDACLDGEAKYVPGKSTLVVMSDSERTLKILLAFINSKISNYYIKEKYSSYSYNGGVTFTKDMINSLPIRRITADQEEEIVLLVDELLCTHNNKIIEIIDRKIVELYELTPDEVAIIDSSMKKKNASS